MKKFLLILALFLSACAVAQEDLVVPEKVEVDTQDFYVNGEFDYQAKRLETFEMSELYSGNGVVFRRQNEAERIYQNNKIKEQYTVEIGVSAEENLMDYQTLGEFLAATYSGYSLRFDERGAFVDEQQGNDGIHHYYLLSKDGSFFIHAYLRTPSYFYEVHKEGFEDFVKSVGEI